MSKRPNAIRYFSNTAQRRDQGLDLALRLAGDLLKEIRGLLKPGRNEAEDRDVDRAVGQAA